MRLVLRYTFRFFLVLLAAVVVLWVLIQLPPIQTALVRALAGRIYASTGIEITIGRVDLRYPLELVLRDVEINDDRGDHVLSASGVFLRSIELDLRGGNYHAYRIELTDPYVRLTIAEGDTLTNIDRMLAHLPESSSEPSETPFRLSTDEVRIRNGRFIYLDFNLPPAETEADFDHVNVKRLNTHVTNLRINDGDIDANIRYLNFSEEGSGFELRHLHGEFAMRSDTLSLHQYVLETPRTRLDGNLIFAFDAWSDFSNFNEGVRMRGTLNNSNVHFDDLALFAPELKGIGRSVDINGRFWGPIANLKVRQLYIGIDDNTALRGRIDLTGLPDLDRTFIDLTIDELTTVKAELDRIPLPPFASGKTLSTPPNLRQLGKVNFHGKFTGFLSDFVAFGTLSTDIGEVSTDIKLKESGTTYAYSGELITRRFDLGRFYASSDLGQLSSNLKVNGRGLTRNDIDATIDGRIKSIKLMGYTYRDIRAAGAFKQNFFNGTMNVADDNIQLDFKGLIDFTEKKPKFDFYTSITHLNPVALNLIDLREYLSISGDFHIRAEGMNFNDINGEVIGDSLRFCTFADEYPIEHLELLMEQNETLGKRFTLDSDVASGRLEGKFDFTGLERGVKQIIADIVPHIEPPPTYRRGREDFYLELTVHNFELVSQIFLPELEIARGSRLALLMDDTSGDFKTTFTSDRISYGDIVMDTLLFDLAHPDESLYATFQAGRADFGIGLIFPQLSIDAFTEKDTVYTNLAWGRKGDVLRGDFAVTSVVRGNSNITNRFRDLNLFFNDDKWALRQPATLTIDSSRFAMQNFFLAHGNEHIRIDGSISENPEETLLLDLQGIQLSMFNPFLLPFDLEQDGLLTGNLQLRDVYNQMLVTCDLLAMDYTLNGYHLGDICAESSWDPSLRRLMMAGDIDRDKKKLLDFSGFYYPESDDSPLDLVCRFNALPLDIANAFIDDDLAQVNGMLNGKLSITGQTSDPQVEGELSLSKASVKIVYLNTTYYLSERIKVYPDMFAFNFPIKDEDFNTGFIVGTVLHEKFSDWNFDIFLDLEGTPFLLLNTTQEQNNQYFGKAYASGFVNVSGAPDDISITVTAKSERGTTIALPLGGSQEVTFADFITFVDHTRHDDTENPVDLSGIRMNFELDITPDAQFRIIFDEVVGDEIRGRGRGNIRMEINNLSTFNMYGNIAVEQGRYLFTLKNLINKEFDVKPGGTITWFGDPLAADINLEAIYRVNTSLFELFPEESEQYRQRVPVNLNLQLAGKLMSPLISFDIFLPNSDELTRARVASAINNEQEVNRQAFALLVLRRFISPPDIAKTNTSIGLAENSTELITSQLSNWLSQISDDFDIGVNYSPGDQISNEEIAVALSTQLFNDRLLVSGSFGVQQAQSTAVNDNPNNLIGDIRIEYKIHPQGKIRIIVYNQSNEFDLVRSRQNQYTQGFGVVFQQEFNSLYDLFGLPVPN